MTSIEAQERYERKAEDQARALFWTERLFLLVILLLSSKYLLVLIGVLLVYTTLMASPLCPKQSSAVPSGIGRLWLFLLDRFMFLVALVSHEAIFFWRLTVFISLAIHTFYIIEYLVRTYEPHHAVSTGIDDDTDDDEEGDVIKKVETTRELVEELREVGKKMDTELESIENIINSDLKTQRKNLSEKLLELREELRDVDGEKMREFMKKFVHSELVNLRDDLRLNVDDILEDVRDEMRSINVEDIKASRGEVKSVLEDVYETYLVIQETAKASKTIADRANLAHLVLQAISEEIQTLRWKIKEEDLERFLELREEVWEMSSDFETTKMEAEDAADRAAEELSSATVELMEAVEIRPWEEYKTD
ncbi:unnamed protein product [Microthlaspi erraticum]|uniref:Uncharacterized protein n=1 Tax=Microthlaspi erraticum TaxID=1685480 RepID=A0A6D2I982_9BRAS|nr:unnamed protein product [Microthlaspi erraticum]